MYLLTLALSVILSTVGSWRPMTLLTRLPTYEYRPPGETHIHWAWGQGPPSASLLPPPPGRPAPAWLSAPVTSTPSSSSAPLGPTSTSSSYPLGPATSSSSDPLGPTSTSSSALLGSAPSSSSAPLGPAATSSSTPLETTSRQPLIVEGHSKVTKYGPVEGSVNSVYVLSGKTSPDQAYISQLAKSN